jgi:multiple sugar transport system substrate-binding protein
MHQPLRLLILIACLLGLNACTPPTDPTQTSQQAATNTILPELTPSGLETTEPPTPTLAPTLSPTPTLEPITLLGVKPDQLRGVTVQFWHSFSGARERLLIEWADVFNTSNKYGITIEITPQENLFNAVQDAIRAGTSPHLSIAFTNQAAAWDQASAPPGEGLIDLTPYINDPVYGYAPDELIDFYPAFLEQETVDEKMIGFPTYRSAQVMFYNITWAQELGFFSPPTTPDEFFIQACSSSEARGDGTGGWFINTDTATTLSWIFAYGREILSLEGDYLFNTPETAAAFGFMKDLADSGCAWQPEETFPNTEFATRQGLFYSSSLGGLFFQQQAFEDAGSQDEWTMIPFPSQDGQPVAHIFGPAYNVFKTTPEGQLAAWLFVQWASSPANQARWTEISGSYPTRASTIKFLNQYVASLPQWTRAYDLVPNGKNEPALPSWGTVRWVVGDAAAQLFGFGFTADGIPGVLEELDRTANEVGGL